MPNFRIPVAGAELAVTDEGTGTAVLVPTGGLTSAYHHLLSQRIRTSLRLIYVDHRGTSGSTGDASTWTPESQADDLEEVRAALALDRVVVLGHSHLGGVAVEYAYRYPDHTVAAIAVASSPDFVNAFAIGAARWETEATPEQKQELADARARFASLDRSSMTEDEYGIETYMSMAPLGRMDPSFDVRSLFGRARGIGPYFERMFEAFATWDMPARIRDVKPPVLAICGRKDYMLPVEGWTNLDVPNVRIEIFENSAHFPMVEERDRFDDILLSFVSELDVTAKA